MRQRCLNQLKNPFLLSLCPSLEPKKDYGLTVLPLVLPKVVSRLSAYFIATVRSLITPFSQHFCACNYLLGSNRLIGRLSGNTARRPCWSAFARLLYKAAWAVEKTNRPHSIPSSNSNRQSCPRAQLQYWGKQLWGSGIVLWHVNRNVGTAPTSLISSCAISKA